MLTPARIACLAQIHRAGFAHRGGNGWCVNGWTGNGCTKLGPTARMIETLIDGAFIGYVESRNRYVREVQLTPFGVAAVLEHMEQAKFGKEQA